MRSCCCWRASKFTAWATGPRFQVRALLWELLSEAVVLCYALVGACCPRVCAWSAACCTGVCALCNGWQSAWPSAPCSCVGAAAAPARFAHLHAAEHVGKSRELGAMCWPPTSSIPAAQQFLNACLSAHRARGQEPGGGAGPLPGHLHRARQRAAAAPRARDAGSESVLRWDGVGSGGAGQGLRRLLCSDCMEQLRQLAVSRAAWHISRLACCHEELSTAAPCHSTPCTLYADPVLP